MTTLALNSLSQSSGILPPSLALPPLDPRVLERNLAALGRTCARTAELVRLCAPRSDVRFLPTDEGTLSVETLDPSGGGWTRALASRRRPIREGELIAGAVDVASTAAVVVMGFGAGHHVGALARRMRRTGVIAVFEPDASLLRAVLERIDHSQWIEDSNTAIFTDADDAAAISAALSGVEGIVMMGVQLLEHAPSLERLGEARTRFYKNFQDVISAVRTTVATTLVQVRTTVANVLRNLPWYVSAPGISDLAGTRAGTPAIVVSAGPSLERNIAELVRPGVRDRFTIIAAQTVLKPLLARGIKPHYVVALDHSEISDRFYEGLTREDLEGVTLVVEPKVSPAVPRAFAGEIRLASDPFLDTLLGPGLARDMGVLAPGATVAHLAYYLARHLGADPVVLVGQDLGFTDGQYYAAGAAIHNVWACELNQFNSLERMEWERIRRMGPHLRRTTDHLGRPIFTDEQLATYLVQFERDFLADTQRGLAIIDATEGGVAKRHTRAERLKDVVDRFMGSNAGPRVVAAASEVARVARPSRRRTEEQVRRVQRDVTMIAELSRKTVALLTEMSAHQGDQERVSGLIDDVYAIRNRVEAMTPAIELAHFLNQAGAFSRIRADRAIQLDQSLTPLERQKREIQRDIANVEVLAQTADRLAGELGVAADVLYSWEDDQGRRAAATRSSGPRAERSEARAHAIIALPAAPSHPVFPKRGQEAPLALTLRRLAHATRIESVVLLAQDPDAWRPLVETLKLGIAVRFHRCAAVFGTGHDLILAARAGALDCWRGGLAGASVYDEVLAPEATLAAMEEFGVDGAIIVGHDWCLVDPQVCDDVIARSERGAGLIA